MERRNDTYYLKLRLHRSSVTISHTTVTMTPKVLSTKDIDHLFTVMSCAVDFKIDWQKVKDKEGTYRADYA